MSTNIYIFVTYYINKLQKVFKKLQKRYSKSYKSTKKGIQKVTKTAYKILNINHLWYLVIIVFIVILFLKVNK